MRIVLVHPAGSNWVPGKKDITPIANRMAPLGLLSIAAWLERAGHHVSVIDCLGPAATDDPDRTTEEILSHRPDLVGFSATTSGFLDGYGLTQRLKKHTPTLNVVFGGVHVSALGGKLLERFDAIDYLVPGEGELTLTELADGHPPAGIAGLIWRDNGIVTTNTPRTQIPDLDDLPFPAYEKLAGFPDQYHLPLFSYIRTPGATMVTSRGCPYQCSYCDRSVFKRKYRYNSAAYIYDHMQYLRERFAVHHINIYDDLFTAHRDRIGNLCERLASQPLGIQFNCAVRVGHVDTELLAMLRRAGCLMVSLGIETADDGLMTRHKPGVGLKGVRRTVRRIQAAGLRVKGLFMMGLPGETSETIRRTSDFAISLGLDDMNMSKFTPFPGAPIWSQVQTEGQLEIDWRRMNCLNFVYLPAGINSFYELDQLYNTHVKRFYTDWRWRKRFARRLWQHRWSLVHLVRHLPTFWAAKRQFEPKGTHI